LQEVVVRKLVRTGAIAITVAVSGLLAATALSATAPSPELVPAQIASDWVRWDKSSCKFVIIPRAQRPKTWTAKMSKARPNTLIGFGEQTESNPFAQAVNFSMSSATKAAGADYFAVNYQWPDTAQPIVQAQSLVAKKPSVAVSFNVISATIPSVNALFNNACIPVIQITQKAPNSVLFGASNENAGRVAGQYLARYVQKKGWNPSEVTLIGPIVPGLGAINKRITECAKVFQAALPKATYSEVTMGASVTTGQQAVTDWLTAHPASGPGKYLVSCTIADIWSIAVANAITSAGRDGNAAVVGQGASLDGIKAIRSGGPIVASTWFDAGRYGRYIVPLALDILANKPVPLAVHQKLLVVDKTNAAKFYRGQ
jgi:ABC-type sugar transport system substrate-binding protein